MNKTIKHSTRSKEAQMAAITLLILLPFALSLFICSVLISANIMRVQHNSMNDLVRAEKHEKHFLEVRVCVEISNSSGILRYEPRIIFINRFNSEIRIDYLVVLLEGKSDIQKEFLLSLKPGEVKVMSPSELDSSLSIYDKEYFSFKDDVQYMRLHTKEGGSFGISWGGVCWKS